MNWNLLQHIDQLPQLVKESTEKKILIFKHSTRCSISQTVLARLERNWLEAEMNNVRIYFLDLIANRNVSNAIAEQFDVEHESPQVLIVHQGKSVYNRSHLEIDYQQIRNSLKN